MITQKMLVIMCYVVPKASDVLKDSLEMGGGKGAQAPGPLFSYATNHGLSVNP